MDIHLLYQRYLTARCVTIDSKQVTPGALFFAIRGNRFNGNAFAGEALAQGASYAIIDDIDYLEPSPAYILVEDALATLHALATHHRLQYGPHFPVIAVTGSYGKTTTKNLIHSVLTTTYPTVATKGNLNTTIGVALTLLSMDQETAIAVVEMGASQLGDIRRCCSIALPTHGLITAIGEAHLDGFDTLEGVLKGKGELYDYLYATQGILFLNSLDPLLASIAGKFTSPITYPQSNDFFSLELVAQAPYLSCKSIEGKVLTTHFLGSPHRYNIAAALCVAKYFKVPMERAYAAIEGYIPVDQRMELVMQGNHQFIIDSYNASPASVEAALDALLQLKVAYRVVVLGDMAALGEQTAMWHDKILVQLHHPGFDLVLLCGPFFAVAAKKQPHAKVHCFLTKEALQLYLSGRSFDHSGFLFKGAHSLQMHTLVKIIEK
ncbi:MAG: UDP-N-acetylmuramoyl-tripeptide--D-alanyl-D-alanine ligase [Amoebophilaceae bacterium]|nr:UDP-N-acetylmuramoyl-tripeptide--D-alanyl-D-alanine ligase [Amoebophilaceae bacterium]